jgi:AraC family transcriptional activator FtrA
MDRRRARRPGIMDSSPATPLTRLKRVFLYLAAFLLLPIMAGALGYRTLVAREHPDPLPPITGVVDVPQPVIDPARPTVVVLFGDDLTEITDALGPYEMFARAGTFNVVAVAPRRQPTLLSGGLAMLPHFSLEEIDHLLGERGPAVVVVPNIPNIAEPANRPLIAYLQKQAAAGVILHSWCKGAMALAEAGLLDGRTATAHWGDLPTLEKRYPRVQWVRGVRWVDHGQILMSAGITSGIDASLRLIERLEGEAVAERVAREIRYPNAHFAKDPTAPQYTLRPADTIVLANAAFHIPRSQIGIALYPGVNELDLSNVYDTHAYTMVADVEAVAHGDELVTTEFGLTLIPSIVLGTPGDEDEASVRRLDRILVPGIRGRELGSSVVTAVAATVPSQQPEYLHADDPERFGLEPVLEDLVRSSDKATAQFALRRMEYRSTDVRFEGSGLPWRVLLVALMLGFTGVGIAHGVVVWRRRPQHTLRGPLLAALIFLLTLLSVRSAFAQEPAVASDDEVASAAASLLYDVRKIVEVQRSAGWKIDHYEYEEMMPDALMSVCSTTDETRHLALAEATREVARLGGPLEDALEENGGNIEDLKDLQVATQVAQLLDEAVRRAPSECSPWMKPQQNFKARQAGVDRFILSLEGSSSGMIQYAPIHPDGTTGFRATHGFGGRLLLGRGFGHHWSVRVGPEINVNSLVRREGNPTDLPLQVQGALPVVVRYTDVSWHYNVEVAPLLMITDADRTPRYGGRLGVLIGVSRLKKRKVIPWVGLGATVELFPGANGQPMLLNLKGGLRAGIDWDF